MQNLKGLFRDLRADEIDVRVQSVSETGFSMLLYKDARCDMNILDETIGAYNWKREHLRDNMNCIVSIFDEKNKQWVGKEDTGTESNTEKEKGLASDSFKRACFNWGIGRELYTSPFIWCSDTSYIKMNKKTNKEVVYERFSVKTITITDKVITALEIVDSKGKLVFSTSQKVQPKQETKETPKEEKMTAEQEVWLKEHNADFGKMLTYDSKTYKTNYITKKMADKKIEMIQKEGK